MWQALSSNKQGRNISDEHLDSGVCVHIALSCLPSASAADKQSWLTCTSETLKRGKRHRIILKVPPCFQFRLKLPGNILMAKLWVL